MRRYLSRINVALMSLVLLAGAVLPAWGRPRPFHLKERGIATFNADGTISSEGTGTATHLGTTTWLVELYSDLTYDVVADGVIDY
jgi:hypothetical protein